MKGVPRPFWPWVLDSKMITLEIFLKETWHILLELSPWLLFGMLLAGILHVLLPSGFIRRHLGGSRFSSVFNAVAVGVPMPLCSCGVIPTAIGLRKDGASKGAATGFLISTPQTGVDSILVSATFLGWPFAIFKVISALVSGLIGGLFVNYTENTKHKNQNSVAHPPSDVTCNCDTTVSAVISSDDYAQCHTAKMTVEHNCCSHSMSGGMDKQPPVEGAFNGSCESNHEQTKCGHTARKNADDVCTSNVGNCCHGSQQEAKPQGRRSTGLVVKTKEAFSFGLIQLLGDIYKWLIIGILAAALISTFISPGRLQNITWTQGLLGMFAMLLISLPMYVCATASVPLAASLVTAGMSPGSALVLLMAGPTTNIATMGAIFRSFGKTVLAIYLTTVIVMSITLGLLFNWLLLDIPSAKEHMHSIPHWLAILAAIGLLTLLTYFTGRDIHKKFRQSNPKKNAVKNKKLCSDKVGG